MSKFLRIQPDGFMELRDLDRERDLLDVIHDELDGGFFEVVQCRTLPRKFIMLVDDCGVLKDLPINPVASVLYTHAIAGTALIMKEDIDEEGEHDIFGMDEDETAELIKKLRGMINREEDDSDFYPYDDADMEQMSRWYEEEYHGKHE